MARGAVIVLALVAALLAVVSAQDAAVLMYYSDSECAEYQGSRTFANGVYTEVRGAAGLTCAQEMECFYNPSSDACYALSVGEHGGVPISDLVSNFSIATSNDDVNTVRVDFDTIARTDVVTYDQCIKSSVYRHCYYSWKTATKFSRELGYECGESLAEESSSAGYEDGTSHIVFYSQQGCTDASLQAIAPIRAGVDYTVRSGNPEASGTCVEQLTCFFNPQSSECGLFGNTRLHRFTSTSVGPNVVVSDFDGTTDQLPARTYTKDTCLESDLYPGCYYSILTDEQVNARVHTCSQDNLAYLSYYSDGECDGESFVATSPVDAQYTTRTQSNSGSCHETARCLWDPQSCDSSNLTSTFFVAIQDAERNFVNYFSSSSRTSYRYDQCLASSWYDNCNFQFQNAEQYHEKFECGTRGEKLERNEDDNNFSHLVYYSSDDCSFDSIQVSRLVGENDLTLLLSDGPTCRESLNCLIEPSGLACQDIATGDSTTFHVITYPKGVTHEYEGNDFAKFNSEYCTESSVYTGCYFRYYTAEEVRTMQEYLGESCSAGAAVFAPVLLAFVAGFFGLL